MSESAFLRFLTEAFKCFSPKLKEGGAFYIWLATKSYESFRKACRSGGIEVKQDLIWVKNNFVIGRQDYQWRHEPCLYGWKEGAAHYFVDDRSQDTVIEDKINYQKASKQELKNLVKRLLDEREVVASTIIREDKPTLSEDHPTMKPVRLIGRLIKNSSRKGETVLDPFGGSGTTLIACEQLGRKCLMMELDPRYCDVIIRRWENLTGKKAEKSEKD